MLPDLWSLHFYEYHGQLEVEGVGIFQLRPGVVSLVPPGRGTVFHYQGVSQHWYCHFRSRQDLDHVVFETVFFEGDPRLFMLRQSLAEMVGFGVQESLRADVRLWDVLHGLAEVQRNEPDAGATHIINEATHLLQQEMSKGHSVAAIAGLCGVSHNKFIQLVREQTGLTPSAWMSQLRTDRAYELLKYSDMPVKAIAYEVGIPDLHYFNKVIRKRFGCAPRQLRRGTSA